MTAEQMAQKVMDKQGYLVCASNRPRQTGEIIPGLNAVEFGNLSASLVVIGRTTYREWNRQNRKYVNRAGWKYPYYYKVIAE